ncbi:hypothetical protein ACIA8O_34190 [Kitasatospora sp. NPDC051853]|uniref:hypothetical protein n=1 Tax=Kitasatospora sp. NPDC051853 TaxID=3364058 RepID=UPI0037A0A82E
MSTNRSRRIDRDTAEQLLAGASGARATGPERLARRTAPPGHAELAGLLASAAAPEACGGEQPGEQAALAAFRAVHSDPSAAARRTTVSTTVRVRAFSAKALLAACAATALGGVAVAAGTGALPHIPGLPGGAGDQVAHAPATATDPGSAARAGGSPSRHEQQGFGASHTATAPPSPSAAASSPSSAASAAGQSAELCRQLAEGLAAGGKRVLLLAEPRFAPLLTAAGGAEAVTEYCAAPGSARPSTSGGAEDQGKGGSHTPSAPAPSATASSGGRKATEKPSDKPTDRPTEKPTVKQGDKPEEQRTGGQPEVRQ